MTEKKEDEQTKNTLIVRKRRRVRHNPPETTPTPVKSTEVVEVKKKPSKVSKKATKKDMSTHFTEVEVQKRLNTFVDKELRENETLVVFSNSIYKHYARKLARETFEKKRTN
ncbi:CHRNA4 [Acrasis kona]|uniref:CHRNA4 n=1 Tax=Acrasis kona TaxID=1008807 RepID=A0AAW2YIP9_9EUKA